MRKVYLKMNESYQYDIIKKVVDSNGSKKRAATKLNCTVRSVNRLINKYKTEGKAGFIHKNRGRKPAITISDEIKQRVLTLYQTKYEGANLRHFSELLATYENIQVSDTTINRWLKEIDILSPKARRKTIKKLKDSLRKRKQASKTKKEAIVIEDKLTLLDRSDVHPRRPRCANFGELIQMDASPHQWFGGMITHLHLAIDDATGKIVGGYFDTQETLQGYYQVLYQILTTYGIPAKLLTDRRTVFEYKRKKNPRDEDDTYTQFSYACYQLGIDLECTSVPQSKGRVERLNQTLQSRLLIEMKIANISTIEEANAFLQKYIQDFNSAFSIPINTTKNVFEETPSHDTINQILAILTRRKIDNGNSIKYYHQYYIPVTKNNHKVYLNKGTDAIVIKSFDNHLYVNIQESIFVLEEIPDRLPTSDNFDTEPKKKSMKKKYSPPDTHPWKRASFEAYLRKQRHRQSDTSV